ncbi:MAG TPA: hypothetical protein VL595_03650 [Pseudonocardia sp.]|nr:hypothetical protein [Pseudonocardia sp.]
MADWAYEMHVPNDVLDDELNEYRELAVATWRTAAEASGARPGQPTARLVEVDATTARRDPVSGEIPRRAWYVHGPVS